MSPEVDEVQPALASATNVDIPKAAASWHLYSWRLQPSRDANTEGKAGFMPVADEPKTLQESPGR